MTYLVPAQALTLDVSPVRLEEWSAAGVVTPAGTAPGATALWDVDQLREQIRRHLNDESR